MMDAVASSVLPLKRYAEFRGRSTRTELLSFYLLTGIAGFLIDFAAKSLDHPEATIWIASGLLLLILVPSLAVGARRLRDTGRSGWWLILASPMVPAMIADYVARPRPWALPIRLDLPWWGILPPLLCLTALIILLLRDDDVDTNRYGPNPRGWTPPQGEPA